MSLSIGILNRNFSEYETLLKQLCKDKELDIISKIIASDTPSDLLGKGINILLGNPNMCADIVDQLDELIWLQSTWAGVNSLMLKDKKNYQLCGVKNIFGEKMSEYIFTYLLNIFRNVSDGQRNQAQRQWQAPNISALAGKSIGILGFGNIGKSVAQTAKAFKMSVNALNRSSKDKSADKCFYPDQLLELASQSDIVLNLLPETSETIGLCDAKFFDAMKTDAVFINAGRGSVINDEQELVAALTNKHIAHAVIDVCKQEPLPATHAFWDCPNLTLTHHSAAVSSVSEVFAIFELNLLAYLDDKPLLYQVDFEKQY